jgi:hypothetical protein
MSANLCMPYCADAVRTAAPADFPTYRRADPYRGTGRPYVLQLRPMQYVPRRPSPPIHHGSRRPRAPAGTGRCSRPAPAATIDRIDRPGLIAGRRERAGARREGKTTGSGWQLPVDCHRDVPPTYGRELGPNHDVGSNDQHGELHNKIMLQCNNNLATSPYLYDS